MKSALAFASLALVALLLPAARAGSLDTIPGGQLQILGADPPAGGLCPLEHTEVAADIAGFFARVTVRQEFHNPADRKIEAVYVFPLPQDAAVDDMTMIVGARRIAGRIKEREEAQAIYEAAKAAGHVASLLDQERPNIFTQSVANIEPGARVTIEISYVETLRFDDGAYEWVFPMVVAPRYIPGGGSAPAPQAKGQDTPPVPDGSRITPPVTPPGTRAGHDISLAVRIEGGLKLTELKSVLHDVDIQNESDGRALVTLRDLAEIPNRDFVLQYRLAGDDIAEAFLVHEDARGRFFTLILQPPPRIQPTQVVPRELVFVLDTSGSMNGFPIDKAKELMDRLIDTMQPADTFNLITFAGDTRILWPQPLPNTPANRDEMKQFLSAHTGAGGTEMMKAIEAALAPAARPAARLKKGPPPIRVVVFLTDGEVGNDMAIIAAVQKYAGTTRVFSFGIGNSINRFLLDGIARAGRGEAEYVTLASGADAAVARFYERMLAPVLTDIQVDWGTLPVADVCPALIPDLFSVQPIVLHGRLTGPASGTITVRGNCGVGPYVDTIDLRWPEAPPAHAALPALWARAQIAGLMMQDYAGIQQGTPDPAIRAQITALGLEYRLMTQYTSFVAVEETTVTLGGEAVRVDVPVEMPAGMSYEGVFGEADDEMRMQSLSTRVPAATGTPRLRAEMRAPPAGGSGGRMGGGVSGGMFGQGQGAGDGLRDAAEPERLGKTVDPQRKLAPALRGLAAKVVASGAEGNFSDGKVKVVGHRVRLVVFLREVSDATREALAALGFEVASDNQQLKVLIGTLDVRKLDELAALNVVLRVQPVP